MSNFQRIRSVLTGLLMIASAAIMILQPDFGYLLVVIFLSVALFAMAIRYLRLYFRMARYMVGGLRVLLIGIIILDFAIFTWNMTNFPKEYVLLYLVGVNLFAGVAEIMSAIEARRLHSKKWRFNLFKGLVDLGMVVLCLMNYQNVEVLTMLYSVGLIVAAIGRIVTAFRRSEIIYIP